MGSFSYYEIEFSKQLLKIFTLYIWGFYCDEIVLIYQKRLYHSIKYQLIKDYARKIQKLPGIFISRKLLMFCCEQRYRGPPSV